MITTLADVIPAEMQARHAELRARLAPATDRQLRAALQEAQYNLRCELAALAGDDQVLATMLRAGGMVSEAGVDVADVADAVLPRLLDVYTRTWPRTDLHDAVARAAIDAFVSRHPGLAGAANDTPNGEQS